MGAFLSFVPKFIIAYNLSRYIGIIIMLICIGIGMRTDSLRRRGIKEKLAKKIKELEDKIEKKN